MNRKKLFENLNKPYRLRPQSLELSASGKLQATDDDWFATPAGRDDEIRLTNQRTRHQLDLGVDHIKNFQSPNFLMLKCIVRFGIPHVGVDIDPIAENHAPPPSADQVLTRALLDTWKHIPGMRLEDLKAVLDDDAARIAWFTMRERDAAGGVLLPTLSSLSGTPSPVRLHLPKVVLYEAYERLVQDKKRELFDPMGGW